MAEPFIGEIRMFGFGEAPQGWALCDGSELEVSQHEQLFDLLGNQFGGDDDQGTFCLPDLRGRVPVSVYRLSRRRQYEGQPAKFQGATGGAETVTLNIENIPHFHHVNVSSENADERDPTGAVLAATAEGRDVYKELTDRQLDPGGFYPPDPTLASLDLDAVAKTGADPAEPIAKMQPYLVLNFCIALAGLIPPP